VTGGGLVIGFGVEIPSRPARSDGGATLSRGEDVIYTGKEQGEFISVHGQNGEGWVHKPMVRK
jgi:hypothetical protein